MTEEEKEAICQRALRRRRIVLGVLAAAGAGVLALLLARLYVRPFYPEWRICGILEERYGCGVTLQRQPGERNERLYRAVCEAWPEVEFTVQEVWYEGCWDSLLPIWHFPRHAVTDYLRAAAWNRYAVPILAEYGLEAPEAGAMQVYNGQLADDGILIPLGTDLDALAADVAEAAGRIREAPVFSDLLAREERIGHWSVSIILSAGEDVQVQTDFRLDRAWTEEEIRAELGEAAERLEGRIERAADRG